MIAYDIHECSLKMIFRYQHIPEQVLLPKKTGLRFSIKMAKYLRASFMSLNVYSTVDCLLQYARKLGCS